MQSTIIISQTRVIQALIGYIQSRQRTRNCMLHTQCTPESHSYPRKQHPHSPTHPSMNATHPPTTHPPTRPPTAAPPGATSALINTLSWMESSGWDGRWGVVIATDVVTVSPVVGVAATGAGAVAILVGPNAPLVIDPVRATLATHTYDVWKVRRWGLTGRGRSLTGRGSSLTGI